MVTLLLLIRIACGSAGEVEHDLSVKVARIIPGISLQTVVATYGQPLLLDGEPIEPDSDGCFRLTFTPYVERDGVLAGQAVDVTFTPAWAVWNQQLFEGFTSRYISVWQFNQIRVGMSAQAILALLCSPGEIVAGLHGETAWHYRLLLQTENHQSVDSWVTLSSAGLVLNSDYRVID